MVDYEPMKRCLGSDYVDRLDFVSWEGDIYVPLSDLVLGRVERCRFTVPSFEIEFPLVVHFSVPAFISSDFCWRHLFSARLN